LDYFISDTHFGHRNIIKYTNRPFVNAKEMDTELIKRWNSRINNKDTVYHLGDFFLCGTDRQFEITDKLKGNIILIRGNHDKETYTKYIRLGFQEVHKEPIIYTRKDDDTTRIILSHRPLENPEHFNIHGHTHNKNQKWYDGKHYSVSVEQINFYPIRFTVIRGDINGPLRI
jgi:calcineurin-like phosphoesterase family protein